MATVVIGRGFPPDISEEEVRKFVLLDPGEDGIKKIDIKRDQKEAKAKIYFLDPKSASMALCFDGMSMKGRTVRIGPEEPEKSVKPPEEGVPDPLEDELKLLEEEIESIEGKGTSESPESEQPVSPTPPPTLHLEEQTTAPATAEPLETQAKEKTSRLPEPESSSVTKTTLETPSATPALGAAKQTKRKRKSGSPRQKLLRQKRVAKRLVLGILLVIALLTFFALTARKSERTEKRTETSQKFQQLDKQLEELEQLLKD